MVHFMDEKIRIFLFFLPNLSGKTLPLQARYSKPHERTFESFSLKA